MNLPSVDLRTLASAALAALVAAALIAAVSSSASLRRRLARVTRRAPQDDERALARVGGLALAAGAFVASALAGRPPVALAGWLSARVGFDVELAPFAALGAALMVGLVDDLRPRGLSAAVKLAAQLGVGGVLVAPLVVGALTDVWGAGGVGAAGPGLALAFALVVGAAVAQNALNTFDNADGAAGGLALIALGASAFPASGALLGFLAFNLPFRGPTRAMLGDAGSHALGVAFLLTPAAWPALALPLLDLARVVWVRRAEGRPIWSGDRAHLAHRLQGLGYSSFAVLAWLVLLAAPSVALGALAFARGTVWPCLLGLVGTAALFLVALTRVSRLERRRPSEALGGR